MAPRAVTALLFFLAALTVAAAPQPSAPTPGQPTFRSEDGWPQSIATFSYVDLPIPDPKERLVEPATGPAATMPFVFDDYHILPRNVPARQNVGLQTVLDRLHGYLADYARQLPATIATEHYEQQAGGGASRERVVLESEFGIMRLVSPAGWLGIRDVVSVNGEPSPNRPDRQQYGAGETVGKATLAAVANAIHDATGVRLRRVPFRNARGLAALKAARVV